MKLISAPENPAILSNVGEIGEFRIRNSAKAFNILSSGLYANKIRAIIRELSCNAVDSHVAAGKSNTPFDVHLPNQLEPWFVIRDYGLGLSHDQVINIYTTYFESTKTHSNEFIGALGLGSKSPFSYTDNFTVTAIKDGRRGIYSAFINEQGVPSIALMSEDETTEPNGVEVKFSVNDHNDYYKFSSEAAQVYTYFKLRPVVSGRSGFQVAEITYLDKDIVPGVHTVKDGYHSVAVMGNIGYPIEIPNADKSLGSLQTLLSCGLEIHFEIGELDFQASREGLSYVTQTVDAIKRKLVALNDVLAAKLAHEADKISNEWERTGWLGKKHQQRLWEASVIKYITDTNFPLVDASHGRINIHRFELYNDELAQKFNVAIRVFNKYSRERTVHERRPNTQYDRQVVINGKTELRQFHTLSVDPAITFVQNDLKIGLYSRVRHHMREVNSHEYYVVMTAADPARPADYAEFLKSIHNPLCVVLASTLKAKPRETRIRDKNVAILHLVDRYENDYRRRNDGTKVWRDAGELDSFDKNETYYYMPLNGYLPITKYGDVFDPKQFYSSAHESGIPNLHKFKLYGVRKDDLVRIKENKNWINIEDYISDFVRNHAQHIKDSIGLIQAGIAGEFRASIISGIKDQSSPYATLFSEISKVGMKRYNIYAMDWFFQRYLGKSFTVDDLANIWTKKFHKVTKRYPLLFVIVGKANDTDVAEYINMVDQVKK